MTSAEYIKREAEEIASRTGRYIPPYRMALLMRTAQKITDQLVKADVGVTYAECLLVLDIVSGAVRGAMGKRAEGTR